MTDGMVGWLDEAGDMNLANLTIRLRTVLKDTADIEALPPETVFRTANGSVGKVFETEYGKWVQWVGNKECDELPRYNSYPFPEMFFPAEVLWSPHA